MPKNKWKLFALSQFLADYTGDGVELFDKLADAEYGHTIHILNRRPLRIGAPMTWAN